MKDVIIAGGGLAGLISAIELSRSELNVLVIEKKTYPFHKVCGEYISNEVVPYLKSLEAYPSDFGVAQINKFLLSSPTGAKLELDLDLGGFGISRYALDQFLYKKAQSQGVEFITGKSAEEIEYQNNLFKVKLSDGLEVEGKIVIGAYGKRSKLDKNLHRAFIEKRSPYIGVKYHIKTDFAKDCVALHNFKDGYCGISKIEGDLYNLCYLSHRDNLKTYGTITQMQESLLYRNPFLKHIFLNSDFVFDKPEVINEITFERKSLIENHILMAGDTAGMITPLCGNGMAIAIHTGKIISECIMDYLKNKQSRAYLESNYTRQWNKHFSKRLWVGRNVQKFFGKEALTEIVVRFFKSSDYLAKSIIKQTHGKVLSDQL